MKKTNNRISEHFSLWELTRSAIALRHGIQNIPAAHEIERLRLLAKHILEPVRQNFAVPFSPSSGFRAPEVNRLAGSKPTSQHILGQAADFEVPTIENRALADWIKDNLDFDQLILEFHQPDDPKSGWVHCSYRTHDNRKHCLIFDGRNYKEF